MSDDNPHAPTQSFPADSNEWSVAAAPPATAAESVETPACIGRCRIEKVLGKGGFGLVYLARDDQLQRPVAIKVPHAKLVARAQDAEACIYPPMPALAAATWERKCTCGSTI